METIKSHLIKKTKLLKNNLIDLPKLEARLLLAKALNKDLNWTYVNLEKKISKKKFFKYEILIKKKLKKFPTAYLLGNKEFYSMNFKVNENTLIPRPETEVIIEEIKKKFQNKKNFLVLDLGTGSGCILLSILKEFKNATGIGIDKYLETVKVARINSKQNNLSKRSKFFKLDWSQKDFFKQIIKINKAFSGNKKFDLVVSNPPYLLKHEINTLMPEVLYEPKESLYDNKDGLSFYKIVLPKINSLVSENSYIYLEINPKNKKNIEKICKINNLRNSHYIKDLSGKHRFVLIKN
jgi:release factor glutamine methyltransferase